MENVTVWKKAEIPERFHYRNNRRIAPIVIVADSGVQILRNKALDNQLEGFLFICAKRILKFFVARSILLFSRSYFLVKVLD